jgi:hypothetical protein
MAIIPLLSKYSFAFAFYFLFQPTGYCDGIPWDPMGSSGMAIPLFILKSTNQVLALHRIACREPDGQR